MSGKKITGFISIRFSREICDNLDKGPDALEAQNKKIISGNGTDVTKIHIFPKTISEGLILSLCSLLEYDPRARCWIQCFHAQ